MIETANQSIERLLFATKMTLASESVLSACSAHRKDAPYDCGPILFIGKILLRSVQYHKTFYQCIGFAAVVVLSLSQKILHMCHLCLHLHVPQMYKCIII